MSSSKKSRSYVSASVELRTFDGFGRRSTTSNLKFSQNYRRRAQRKRYRMEHISGDISMALWLRTQLINVSSVGLSFQDREDAMAVDPDSDSDYELGTLPPGEEAMFMSHEGGEEELCREFFEDQALPQ